MKARSVSALALATALAALGSLQCLERPFVCQSNAQCVLGEKIGVCEPDRRCSFPDTTCPSQRRYADYGTDQRCVSAACGSNGGPCCEGGTCQAGLICSDAKCQCAVSSIAAGDSHTCFAFADGRVLCSGNNTQGQLGDGTLVSRPDVREVPDLRNVLEVASFDVHTCALLHGGSVQCWGANSRGQLGDGSMTTRMMPKEVSRFAGAVEIAVGLRHSCARKGDGSIHCWGDNAKGQLGDGSLIPHLLPAAVRAMPGPAEEIAAGDEFTCARLRNGQVACFGGNSKREIDIGVDPQFVSPKVVSGVDSAVELVVGSAHACARKADGTVLCWGAASLGQTGRGGMPMFAAPAPVMMVAQAHALVAGKSHSCALLDGDRVACWGSNSSGQVGADKPDPSLVPVLSTISGAVALSAGARHTCARLKNGTAVCWGDRSEGQTADDFPVIIPKPHKVDLLEVVEVAGGGAHTCARTKAGAVHCWGAGSYNRLADRDTRSRPGPTLVAGLSGVVQLAMGNEFGCARRVDGVVLCWGRGDSGQIGDGAKKTQAAPQPVALPDKATDISAGASHACAVVGGHVHCWGSNSRSQIGVQFVMGMTDTFPRPSEILELDDVVEVAAGSSHTCARRGNGVVFCWGANDFGQLGNGGKGTSSPLPTQIESLPDTVEISSGSAHTCARLRDGGVACWGYGAYGQLGSGVTTDKNVRPMIVPDLPAAADAIAAAAAASCAATEKGTFCWGQNRHGEIGDGTQTQRVSPVAIAGSPPRAVALGLGDVHACLVTSMGELHCWGRNQNGEVGIGEALARPTPGPVKLGCR